MNLLINDIEQEQNLDNQAMIAVLGGLTPHPDAPYPPRPFPFPFPIPCCHGPYRVPKVKFLPRRKVHKLRLRRRVRLHRRMRR